jgi:transcriptional regulator with XRE-family HTH domain
MNDLSERVKLRREKLGLTQKQLAARARMTPANISFIESGQTKNPGLISLLGLSKGLDCSIDYLIGSDKMQRVRDQIKNIAIDIETYAKSIQEDEPELAEHLIIQTKSLHKLVLIINGEKENG